MGPVEGPAGAWGMGTIATGHPVQYQSERCVHIFCTKSNRFSVGVGLFQGFPLPVILFVIFVN